MSKNSSNFKKLLKILVKRSLAKLKLQKIYAILFHDSKDLLSKNGQSIFKALNDLKKSGVIMNVGISVYNVSELESLVKNLNLTLFQSHLIYLIEDLKMQILLRN